MKKMRKGRKNKGFKHAGEIRVVDEDERRMLCEIPETTLDGRIYWRRGWISKQTGKMK